MSQIISREAVALAAAKSMMLEPDEDMIAEARLGALLCPSADASVVWLAARSALVDYLRRMWGRKDERQYTEKRTLSLDGYVTSLSSRDGLYGARDRRIDQITAEVWNKDDVAFWEEALHAVEARDIWRNWRRLLTPAQHAAVWRWLFLGESQKEVARALHCHPSWVQQLQRAALDRLLDDAGWPKVPKARGRWRGD